MHRLAPDFIIQQYAAGKRDGRFPGSVLFVDVSGFSAVTEALMAHGQHGAEVLATVMRAIFEPLVNSVYAYGGFIANFAGDAFTAVFPNAELGTRKDEVNHSSLQALAAGWQIQTQMPGIARQETPYSPFNFSVKVGLGSGEVEWGILSAADEQRAAYYFKGTAVTNSAAAEHLAGQGDFVLDAAAYAVVQERVEAVGVGNFYRVTPSLSLAVTGLPDPRPFHQPPVNVDLLARFFPRDLVTQPQSGEFRQIFNLFIGLDDTVTPDTLARFMEIVFSLQDRYGGLLSRVDFGDKGCNLLLFWGAPVTYENDIQRVLNFILDLRAQSPLPLRAGVTYRVAHAGFNGSVLREEYTCYGRGVNLAARFMASAGWGEVWIDKEVEARARQFHTGYLGERPFKGFAHPQSVYTLLGREQREATPLFPGHLVGRGAELQQLDDALQPLLDGRFAGVVTVVGEPGIGKSRLVHEFLEEAEVLDFVEIYLCQTDEILRQPLNSFRYWLRDYFSQSPEQDEAANKSGFDRILEGLIKDTTDVELAGTLERGRSFLGALLDLYWPDSLYAQLEPQLRFENTLAALKALVKAESQRQPVLIVLEDAHWLDEDSRHFLRRLTRNVAGYPFAVLITSREALDPELLETGVSQTTLLLEPLPETAVSQLVTTILGREPAPELLQFLVQRTDGNPYFIEQLLLYLRENDLLRSETAVETLKATASLIPTDVQAVLVARLDRLPLPVKDVVQTAAVLGREFEQPILAHMRGETEPELEERMVKAEREAVWRALDERRYLFRHVLMRDAAYGMQLHIRLQQLHRQAALAYETLYQTDPAAHYSQIAYHYDQARVVVKALEYYERAADQARENYQNEAALAHYGRALALSAAGDVEARYRLLLGREAVLSWLGRREAQQADLAQLSELAARLADESKLAETTLRRAALALATGDYETAVTAAQQSAAHAQAAHDPLAEARAHHRWGRAHWQQGQYQKARPYLERALNLARAGHSQEEEARCFYDLSVLGQYQNNYQDAQNNLKQALSIYQALNDKRGEINCYSLWGIIYYRMGKYVDAQIAYENTLDLSRAVGLRYAEARVLSYLADNFFEIGHYEQAILYHQRAITSLREIDDKEAMAASLDTLGLIYHFSGQLTEARKYYDRSIAIQEGILNLQGLGYVLNHLGYCLILTKNYEQAHTVFKKALEIRRQLDARELTMDTLAGLAKVSLLTNNLDLALEYVVKITNWIDSNGPTGIEFPAQVYLICYQVLQAASQNNKNLQIKAQNFLDAGYYWLQDRATQIEDQVIRQQLMKNVPYNRDLIGAWEAANKESS